MKATVSKPPMIVPLDDTHARMLAYGRSPDGQAHIAAAEAAIEAGHGILADERYFETLKTRRAERRATS